MHPLNAHQLLQTWEWGERRHPVDRALILLAATCPDRSHEELAALPIGRRDALLLQLRELTWGPRLQGFAACPACGERLEFTLSTADLLALAPEEGGEAETCLTAAGLQIHFRLPNSLDMAAVAGLREVQAVRAELARRCVLQALEGQQEVDAGSLPEPVLQALAQQVAALDPLAEVSLDLSCLECGHHWSLLFDIVDFFWAEIADRAQRLLTEVHSLARAYGWREADVLALSPRRRQLYLEMVS